jgi:peptide/nickel transport system substrate-binding protein
MGHDPGLAPDAYGPAVARGLAGRGWLSAGLVVTLHGPNDRCVHDAQILQAVARMWTRVGIRTG